VAVVVLLLLGSGFLLWQWVEATSPGNSSTAFTSTIQAGSSKAVVKLATGENITLSGDTTLTMEVGSMVLINRRDTLQLASTERRAIDSSLENVILIPRGGEYIVRLEDGTVVYLNVSST
jgi:hypothetical protein